MLDFEVNLITAPSKAELIKISNYNSKLESNKKKFHEIRKQFPQSSDVMTVRVVNTCYDERDFINRIISFIGEKTSVLFKLSVKPLITVTDPLTKKVFSNKTTFQKMSANEFMNCLADNIEFFNGIALQWFSASVKENTTGFTIQCCADITSHDICAHVAECHDCARNFKFQHRNMFGDVRDFLPEVFPCGRTIEDLMPIIYYDYEFIN